MTTALRGGRVADLDRERIAAAALAVADAHGATGFTMRAVAEALGVTPMALYHHVDDKAALTAAATSSLAIVGIVEEEKSVFRELARPADKALTPVPNARQLFAARHDRDAEFELLVRALIDGLHTRLRRD